jgi:hypothetical protein
LDILDYIEILFDGKEAKLIAKAIDKWNEQIDKIHDLIDPSTDDIINIVEKTLPFLPILISVDLLLGKLAYGESMVIKAIELGKGVFSNITKAIFGDIIENAKEEDLRDANETIKDLDKMYEDGVYFRDLTGKRNEVSSTGRASELGKTDKVCHTGSGYATLGDRINIINAEDLIPLKPQGYDQGRTESSRIDYLTELLPPIQKPVVESDSSLSLPSQAGILPSQGKILDPNVPQSTPINLEYMEQLKNTPIIDDFRKYIPQMVYDAFKAFGLEAPSNIRTLEDIINKINELQSDTKYEELVKTLRKLYVDIVRGSKSPITDLGHIERKAFRKFIRRRYVPINNEFVELESDTSLAKLARAPLHNVPEKTRVTFGIPNQESHEYVYTRGLPGYQDIIGKANSTRASTKIQNMRNIK